MTKCKHDKKRKDCAKCCKSVIKALLPGYSELKALNDIQQRFYLYLDSASKAKNFGRDPDQSITTAALNTLGSILYPNFEYFAFVTVGLVITPTPATPAGVEALYGFFANNGFNAFSQHFANNLRVTLIPNTYPRKAIMTAVGGEHASVIADATTTPITTTEQLTISNWCLEWIEIGHVWYINIYVEYGDRLYRLYPGNDPANPTPQTYSLFFQRLYPNAILENTIPPGQNAPALPVPIVLPCTKNQSDTAITPATRQVVAGDEKILKITKNKEEWAPQLLSAFGIKK